MLLPNFAVQLSKAELKPRVLWLVFARRCAGTRLRLSYTASSISDRQQLRTERCTRTQKTRLVHKQSGETFDLYWGLRLDLVGGARGQQVPSSRNVQASVLETPDPSACEAFERGQLREKKLLQIRVPDLAGNC